MVETRSADHRGGGSSATMVGRGTAAVRPLLHDLGKTTVVGTAGMITPLAAMAQRLHTYDPARIHRLFKAENITELERNLLASTQAERHG